MGKYLIDISTFKSVHLGGKDEVALNLLRGFAANDHLKDILVLCKYEMIAEIDSINPDIGVIEIDSASFYKNRMDKIIREHGVKAVLFTNKTTPRMRFSVPTIMIPAGRALARHCGWALSGNRS